MIRKTFSCEPSILTWLDTWMIHTGYAIDEASGYGHQRNLDKPCCGSKRIWSWQMIPLRTQMSRIVARIIEGSTFVDFDEILLYDKFRWYFFNFQPTVYKKMVYLLSRQFLRWSDNLRSGIIRITITPINLCYSLNYDRWAYGRRPMNRGTHHPCLRKCLTNGKFIRAIWQWQMDDSAPPRFLVWKDLFEKLPR